MKKLSLVILTIAGALVSAAPALADTVSYNLTTVDPTVAAGGTVTFDGSITAPPTNTGSIAILSDFYSCTGCTVDDTDFYLDTPYELAPGDNYTGPLFTVTTFSTDVLGNYDGSFDIQFADASGNTFTDSAPFDVNVTPEPASWLLLGAGLAGVGLLRRRFLPLSQAAN
jgi:type 1 fimbria pilin